MSPITHLLVGWTLARSAKLGRSESTAVALAGVAPDLDGVGIVPEFLTRNSAHPLTWFSDYHHLLGHNLIFAVIVTLFVVLVLRRQHSKLSSWSVALLALLSFHLHLLCDLIGARGPDGYQWPIPYLWPFSDRWQWTWSRQWPLNAWQNILLTVALLAFAMIRARRDGFSPVGIFSRAADEKFIVIIRQRFPLHSQAASSPE